MSTIFRSLLSSLTIFALLFGVMPHLTIAYNGGILLSLYEMPAGSTVEIGAKELNVVNYMLRTESQAITIDSMAFIGLEESLDKVLDAAYLTDAEGNTLANATIEENYLFFDHIVSVGAGTQYGLALNVDIKDDWSIIGENMALTLREIRASVDSSSEFVDTIIENDPASNVFVITHDEFVPNLEVTLSEDTPEERIILAEKWENLGIFDIKNNSNHDIEVYDLDLHYVSSGDFDEFSELSLYVDGKFFGLINTKTGEPLYDDFGFEKFSLNVGQTAQLKIRGESNSAEEGTDYGDVTQIGVESLSYSSLENFENAKQVIDSELSNPMVIRRVKPTFFNAVVSTEDPSICNPWSDNPSTSGFKWCEDEGTDAFLLGDLEFGQEILFSFEEKLDKNSEPSIMLYDGKCASLELGKLTFKVNKSPGVILKDFRFKRSANFIGEINILEESDSEILLEVDFSEGGGYSPGILSPVPEWGCPGINVAYKLIADVYPYELASGDFVRTQMVFDALSKEIVTDGYYGDINDEPFIWSDLSADPYHTFYSGDWTNSHLLNNDIENWSFGPAQRTLLSQLKVK